MKPPVFVDTGYVLALVIPMTNTTIVQLRYRAW